ncbi:MAG: radical SAM protein [Sphingobacteriia bacterium]|nr:radical SAM protein [Sphingobacteriia bacterium]NCC39374.1 radical SAM protein [Gammaproteobacteria bacterium]
MSTDAPPACPPRPRRGARLQVEPLGTTSDCAPVGRAVAFVLDPDQPSWALVNAAGLDVLAHCDGRHSPAEIASRLTGEKDPETAAGVSAFLARMAAAGLVSDGTPAPPETAAWEVPAKNRFHSLAIEITRACNLHCRHCYLAAGEAGTRELTTTEILRVIDQVKAAGGTSISLGGGEPLLHPDWYRLVTHALDQGLLVALGSNGTLIDRALAATLARLPIKIQLSLDGASAAVHDQIRGVGSYARTRAAIDHLRAAGKGEDLVVAFTPMQLNHTEVAAFIDLMTTLEIRVVQFPPLACAGRARRHWSELILEDTQRLAMWRVLTDAAARLRGRMDLLADCFSLGIDRPGEPYRCNIGSQLRLDPDGNLYPCQCFHRGSAYRLGNVREQDLATLASSEHLQVIISDCLSRPTRIPSCASCRWMNLCGAGCMGNAFEANGDALTADGCQVREQWLRALFAARIGQMPASRMDPTPAPLTRSARPAEESDWP